MSLEILQANMQPSIWDVRTGSSHWIHSLLYNFCKYFFFFKEKNKTMDRNSHVWNTLVISSYFEIVWHWSCAWEGVWFYSKFFFFFPNFLDTHIPSKTQTFPQKKKKKKIPFVRMVTHWCLPILGSNTVTVVLITRIIFFSVFRNLPGNKETSQTRSYCVCEWTLPLPHTRMLYIYLIVYCVCVFMLWFIVTSHVMELICIEHKL